MLSLNGSVFACDNNGLQSVFRIKIRQLMPLLYDLLL